MLNKLKKLYTYRYYYLETWAKRGSGRGLQDPVTNGEFDFLRRIVARHAETRILDIGANIGEYVEAALQVPNAPGLRIHAVEAHPAVQETLRAKLTDPRASLGAYAVSAEAGEATFYAISDKTETSGSDSLYGHPYLTKGIPFTVPVTTISDVMAELGWEHVHLAKLDIEGAEVPALRGARAAMQAHAIDFLQLEYNQTWITANASLRDVFDLCEETGYKIFRLAPWGLLPLPGYSFLIDDFFFQTVMLMSPNAEAPMPIGHKPMPLI